MSTMLERFDKFCKECLSEDLEDIAEKPQIEDDNASTGSASYSDEDLEKFLENLFDDETSEETTQKPKVFEFRIGRDKMERILDNLGEIKGIVTSCAIPNDPEIIQFSHQLDEFRDIVLKLMEYDRKGEASQIRDETNFITREYFAKKLRKLKKRMEEIKKKLNDEQPETAMALTLQKPKIEKPKNLIIKIKSPKQFLRRIRCYLKKIPNHSVSLLGNNNILLSFEKRSDCKQLKIKLEKNYPQIKIFEEKEENVEIAIRDATGLTSAVLQSEIEKISGEKPYYVSLMKENDSDKWRAYAGVSSLTYLKMQAVNETAISINAVEYKYRLTSEDETFW